MPSRWTTSIKRWTTRKSLKRMDHVGEPAPVSVQIAGYDPAMLAEAARFNVDHGAEIVLNPTNGSSYWLTQVQSQQIASSALRAVESGRWVVQAAPTGFSEFVTPDGDVIARTAVGEQAVIRQEVELRTGRTWYVTLGDAPFVVAIALTLLTVWVAGRRRTAGSPTPSEPVLEPAGVEP